MVQSRPFQRQSRLGRYLHKMSIRLASAAHKTITTTTKNMIRYFISRVSVCTVKKKIDNYNEIQENSVLQLNSHSQAV